MPPQTTGTSAHDNRHAYLEQLDGMIRQDNSGFVAHFQGMSLRSAFQPIFSVVHRRAVGHEGLLRATRSDGQPVPPPMVFATVGSSDDGILVDRLTRMLHVRNYQRFVINSSWLFLNVNAGSISSRQIHGPFIGALLQHFGLHGHEVVIEILEGAIPDQAQLLDASTYFKNHGCLTAIDDFGTGHSNFDRVWRLSPDFVKLDRSLIQQGATDRRIRKLLPHLVSLLHETGALVIMEGVETEEEAMIALDSDVDLVQGFLFGRPAADISSAPPQCMSSLCARFRGTAIDSGATGRAFRSCGEHLAGVVDALAQGRDMTSACTPLIAQPGVLRCYLLDEQGSQIGPNHLAPAHSRQQDARFAPLADTSGANWFRRPYFRRAMANPNQTQLTRPYFSITDVGMCLTMSRAYEYQGHIFVFCCDLKPQESP